LPIGGAGILYTKKLINIRFIKDECFLKLAPTSDDIWFRLSSMLNGTDVFVNPVIDRDNIHFKNKHGLHEINLYKKRTKNILLNNIEELLSAVLNYLGISNSNNDISWKRAYLYACKKYKYK